MDKENLAKKEFEVAEWMHKKGYDRRATKEVSPIIAKYFAEQVCQLPIDTNKVFRFDQPYSLPEVLKALVECADILLHEKSYDREGWERLEYCYRHGKDIIQVFEPDASSAP